jgi:hypothetical protein
MSTYGNGIPLAVVDQARNAAFAEAGYVHTDGSTIDREKYRATMYEHIKGHKCLTKKDRASNALRRGDLVHLMFPAVTTPDDIDDINDSDERELAKALWAALWKDIWNECRTDANVPMQRMVGVNMGNGYVLCRTKVGKEAADAVYVSDDKGCIQQDFTRPENEALAAKSRMAVRNREMLILRQPHNAKAYLNEYAATMRNALGAGMGQLQLALPDEPESDEDEGDE